MDEIVRAIQAKEKLDVARREALKALRTVWDESGTTLSDNEVDALLRAVDIAEREFEEACR